jgi:hypothetical protein
MTAHGQSDNTPMSVQPRIISCLIAILLVMVAPLWSHHGDAGRYDEKLITLSGRVVELQMVNPHVMIILDVETPGGQVTRWHAEMGAPNPLARAFGWTRNTLKPGDKITLIGRRPKSGSPYLSLTERAVVYLTETKRLLFKTSNADVPEDVNLPALRR